MRWRTRRASRPSVLGRLGVARGQPCLGRSRMSGAVTGSHRLLPFGAVAAAGSGRGGHECRSRLGRLERPSAIATTGCAPGSIHRLRSSRLAYAAVARGRVVARGAPHGRFVASFGRLNVNGVRTVFGIVSATMDGSCRATWYRVQLPVRPNGTTGWVRARDVAVQTITTRILVDLSQHRVTLYQSGRPILVAPAVIGSGSTPTPTGHYYVNQRLLTRNAFGAYGPGRSGSPPSHPPCRAGPRGADRDSRHQCARHDRVLGLPRLRSRP